MKIWKINLLLAILGLPALFISIPVGTGWIIGNLIMALLYFSRVRFYDKLLDGSKFKMSQYGAYIFYTIVLIAGPLLFSFFYPKVMEPFAIFAAYFVSRILTFVQGIFKKEMV